MIKQAYERGFIKAAQESGLSLGQAIDLLQKEADGADNYLAALRQNHSERYEGLSPASQARIDEYARAQYLRNTGDPSIQAELGEAARVKNNFGGDNAAANRSTNQWLSQPTEQRMDALYAKDYGPGSTRTDVGTPVSSNLQQSAEQMQQEANAHAAKGITADERRWLDHGADIVTRAKAYKQPGIEAAQEARQSFFKNRGDIAKDLSFARNGGTAPQGGIPMNPSANLGFGVPSKTNTNTSSFLTSLPTQATKPPSPVVGNTNIIPKTPAVNTETMNGGELFNQLRNKS